MKPTHEVVRPIGGSNNPPCGTLVDASNWPTLRALEGLGKLRRLTVVEVESAPALSAATPAPADEEQPDVATPPVENVPAGPSLTEDAPLAKPTTSTAPQSQPVPASPPQPGAQVPAAVTPSKPATKAPEAPKPTHAPPARRAKPRATRSTKRK